MQVQVGESSGQQWDLSQPVRASLAHSWATARGQAAGDRRDRPFHLAFQLASQSPPRAAVRSQRTGGLPPAAPASYAPALGRHADKLAVGWDAGRVQPLQSHPEGSLPTLLCTRAWLGKAGLGQFRTGLWILEGHSMSHECTAILHRHSCPGCSLAWQDAVWPVLSSAGLWELSRCTSGQGERGPFGCRPGGSLDQTAPWSAPSYT